MTEQLEDLHQKLFAAQTRYAKARAVISPQLRALENDLRDHRNKCSAIKASISRLERARERTQERSIVKGTRVSLFDLLLSGDGNTENYQFYSKSGRELDVNVFTIEIDIEGLPFYEDESLPFLESGEKLKQSGVEWVSKNIPEIVLVEKELFVRDGMITIRSTDVAKLKAAYEVGGLLAKIWTQFKKSGRNVNLTWKDIFVIERKNTSPI